MTRYLLAAAALAAANFAHADEGMWMPQQLPQIAKAMKAAGLKSDPQQLARLTEFPMGAVISLGGCTASFVSPLGLVVTNHHCAYGSIQVNSTPKRDLLKNGFLAATLADELPAAPGTRVLMTVAVSDVTPQVIDARTAALTGKARVDAVEANEKALIAACEADGGGKSGHRCNVASFYAGVQYQLIKQLEIRDVRLVHAPAQGVGLFGGDTDNWMWPRHTGDYSFYRAYVGADGKPADFDAANKPFVPPHHLTIASPTTSPLNAGDFVMVTGYPGRTHRLSLPSEMEFAFSVNQPARIKAMGEQLALIAESTAGRRDAEIKLADTRAGIGNYYKNLKGQQESYDDDTTGILARKQATFAALATWVNADAKRRALYGDDLATTARLLTEREATARAEFLLQFTTPRLLTSARTLYQRAQQQALPDAQRKAGYQARDLLRQRQALEVLDARYDEATDKRLAAHFLAQYLAGPADSLNGPLLAALGLRAGMDEAAVRARLDAVYAGSQLANKAERLAWLNRDSAAFQASSDSFIAAAVALYADDQRRETRDKELAGQLQAPYAHTMQALIAFKASQGQVLYPDANSTLRVNFGVVTGRTPGADGSNWLPFTTLRGITAKHTGSGDFDAPQNQLEAIKASKYGPYGVKTLGGSVPVNFLATLDTTGGNSGSPVLNAKAELVGLLFDGTLDAVIADWDFNPKTTRSIVLDARYMLWQMTYVDKADRLLREMGIAQ